MIITNILSWNDVITLFRSSNVFAAMEIISKDNISMKCQDSLIDYKDDETITLYVNDGKNFTKEPTDSASEK